MKHKIEKTPLRLRKTIGFVFAVLTEYFEFESSKEG